MKCGVCNYKGMPFAHLLCLSQHQSIINYDTYGWMILFNNNNIKNGTMFLI